MDTELYLQFREWEGIFEALHYRGRIAFDNSIVYVIHTNEQGHNKPHLHAQYQDKEIVLEIPTGNVLGGNLARNKAKWASKWVQSHADYITTKWNELSNGIKLPVR